MLHGFEGVVFEKQFHFKLVFIVLESVNLFVGVFKSGLEGVSFVGFVDEFVFLFVQFIVKGLYLFFERVDSLLVLFKCKGFEIGL